MSSRLDRTSIESRIAAVAAVLPALQATSPQVAALVLQALGIAQQLLLQTVGQFEQLELHAKLAGKSVIDSGLASSLPAVGFEGADVQLRLAETLLRQYGQST